MVLHIPLLMKLSAIPSYSPQSFRTNLIKSPFFTKETPFCYSLCKEIILDVSTMEMQFEISNMKGDEILHLNMEKVLGREYETA